MIVKFLLKINLNIKKIVKMNTASYITELRKCKTLAGCCSGLVGPQGPAGPGVPPLYASFISTAKQSVVRNTANPNSVAITYTSKAIGGPINVLGPYPSSQIVIPITGVYRVLFSADCDSDGGTHTVEIFPTINGVSVPDSNTRVSVDDVTETALTVEFILSFNANDILELRMTGDNTATAANAHLSYTPPIAGIGGPQIPAVPSIILIIQRIE